eukprot:TRINITY_DN562_c1_g1_i14.p1 TRINITY_DN562_c1_g1~~TRINITY_DN562_c1_g1_i14.p1  ORF type:complete len:678 (+),score=233.45 TRINITY_DN562_c1_g1_i14:339-2372(+)
MPPPCFAAECGPSCARILDQTVVIDRCTGGRVNAMNNALPLPAANKQGQGCYGLAYALQINTAPASPGGTLLAAVVFTAHPLHAENVASLVGRADILSFVFTLAVVEAWLAAARRHDAAAAGEPVHTGLWWIRVPRLPVGWVCAAVAAYLAAAASKESGLLALALAAAFDLILHGRCLWGGLRATPALQRAVQRTLVAAVLSVAALWLSVAIRGARLHPSHHRHDNPIAYEGDPGVKALWYAHVHYWYLVLLVFPAWSCQDWGYDVIPRPDPASPEAFLRPAAAYAVMFLLPAALLQTRRRDGVAVAAALIFLPMLPASGVVRVATVLAERLLYIPSAGYGVALGLAYDAVHGHEPEPPVKLAAPASSPKPRRRAAAPKPPAAAAFATEARVVLALYVVWLAVLAVLRSEKWESPTALYAAGAKSCPRSAKGRHQLASALYQEHAQLKRERGDDPAAAEAGEALLHRAAGEAQAALDINPSFSEAHLVLAQAARQLKQRDQHERHVELAVRHGPDNAEAHEEFGMHALLHHNDLDLCVKHLGAAVALWDRRKVRVKPDVAANYGLALTQTAGGDVAVLTAGIEAIFRGVEATPPHPSRCVWVSNIVSMSVQSPHRAEADLGSLDRSLRLAVGECRAALADKHGAEHMAELDALAERTARLVAERAADEAARQAHVQP